MNLKLKLLWTITSSPGTLTDLKMLKEAEGFDINIITADHKRIDYGAFTVADKNYYIPNYDDDNYLDSIMDICNKEKITTIIPQYGGELMPLSQNIKKFEGMGISVLVTEDTKGLETANNKIKLYEYFNGMDFIPEYRKVADIEELEGAIYALGYPDNPVCIKPAEGEGGSGFWIVTDENIDVFNEIDRERINWDTLKSQLVKLDTFPEVIVTEYLSGSEYSVDCVAYNGKSYVCIPRERLETAMGVAIVTRLKKDQRLIDISEYIISKLNLSYNINVQFKYSKYGKPKLLEINPRVSGSLVANLGAGVNMLEASLRLAYKMPIKDINIKWGASMIKYWDQLFMGS
jgi:carbamoyl-phosphate synthase large subunit